jgi:hypothetical protein
MFDAAPRQPTLVQGGTELTSRVETPTSPRAWWIVVGVAAGIAWLTTSTSNIVAWIEVGDGVPPQFNALGFSLAGSLTIAAVLLFALRMLRQGQRDICGAVEVATKVAVQMEESCAGLLRTMEINARATDEVCQSYARTLQELNATLNPQQLRELTKAREGRLN